DYDKIGDDGVTPLTNGNYVVASSYWDNGSVKDTGAVTFGDGLTGVAGVVSAKNSLVGSKDKDEIGDNGVTSLENGNYVIPSPGWDNGNLVNAGAVTFANGNTGVAGVVSAKNSLVGSKESDSVGGNGVKTLPNGNGSNRRSGD